MSGRLVFAFPGDLSLKTGGYGYDRQVIAGLEALGWVVNLLPLGQGFPFPDEPTLADAQDKLSSLPDGTLVMIDGLAYGVMGPWASRESDRLRIIALVHHPLALETGLDEAQQRLFRASETKALSAARHTIVTSSMTAREVAENYGLNADKVTVAVPGTEKPVQTKITNSVPHILSIGSLTRRKGHDVLISALHSLTDLDWRATIVGSPDLDILTATALQAQLQRLELTQRITLAGEIADPSDAYASADIFALASRYEGYGMVFAEALSHGLPIVACRAGAVPDVVPENAGILVPVDDVQAFAVALRTLLTDEQEREVRSMAAARAGAVLPDWQDTSLIISNAIGRFL